MKHKLKNLILFSLIISILSTLPIYAADGDEENIEEVRVIEFEDIESIVLENNLQLKLLRDSTKNMQDARDAERDAIREASRMESEAGEGAPSISFMPTITNNQIKLSKLNEEQAQLSLVNGAEKIFTSIKQLDTSLDQLKLNKIMAEDQLKINEVRLDYGLVSESILTDLKTSIKELESSYNSLVNQRDYLEIQFKNMLNLPLTKEIELGSLYRVGEDIIESIDLEEDTDLAIDNSMSLIIQKQEQSNSKTDSQIRKNQNKISQKDIELSMLNQYNLILENLQTLKNSKLKLENLEKQHKITEFRYIAGLISQVDFNSSKNEIEQQKLTVKLNELALFTEVENYDAMKNGMI